MTTGNANGSAVPAFSVCFDRNTDFKSRQASTPRRLEVGPRARSCQALGNVGSLTPRDSLQEPPPVEILSSPTGAYVGPRRTPHDAVGEVNGQRLPGVFLDRSTETPLRRFNYVLLNLFLIA